MSEGTSFHIRNSFLLNKACITQTLVDDFGAEFTVDANIYHRSVPTSRAISVFKTSTIVAYSVAGCRRNRAIAPYQDIIVSLILVLQAPGKSEDTTYTSFPNFLSRSMLTQQIASLPCRVKVVSSNP